ncbi:hypothetical protein F5141DRAFT_100717 [Pisolithus sp. B1]|nr:hypothetical protein F5141DRAFT_100717 [Pisolithus sp. B1]
MVSDTILGGYEVVAATRSIHNHSAASLVVLLWDFLLTMDDEVRRIWPVKKRPLKWLYMFLRYFPLSTQIFHQIVLPDLSGNDTILPLACNLWHVYMIVLIQVINVALELVLALRVVALFGGHPWVSRLLGCIMVVEFLCAVPVAWESFRYYEHCILFILPPVVLIQAVASLVIQTTFICMTLYRILIRGSRFWKTTVMFQVARDGTIVYFVEMGLICCVFAMLKLHWQPAVLFFWIVTIRSICGTRLILNMARLRSQEVPQDNDDILFTTQIDVPAHFIPEDGVYRSGLTSIQNLL